MAASGSHDESSGDIKVKGAKRAALSHADALVTTSKARDLLDMTPLQRPEPPLQRRKKTRKRALAKT